jgi:hypothetical protein
MNVMCSPTKEVPLKVCRLGRQRKAGHQGKLHSKGDIPFETKGTVSTTPDDRLRVKMEKVKALRFEGRIRVLRIELASVQYHQYRRTGHGQDIC